METTDTLEAIKRIAKQAHGDQRRKFVDEPYTAHLFRVMNLCSEYNTSMPVLAAALLHDVLEDTDVTAEQLSFKLAALMSEKEANTTMLLVNELTDRYIKAAYPLWNRRKRKQKEAERMAHVSADAQTIKYADIIDNSLDIVNAGTDFSKKYLLESIHLLKNMIRGDQRLYKRATETVNRCLSTLTAS